MDLTPTEAHPESMDFLSRAWCNFAVQALQPETAKESSLVLLDNSIKSMDTDIKSSFMKLDNSMKMDSPEHAKAFPPWKSNDVKSWIWMQQAMHPELNYQSYFRKKWKFPWKIIPFKNVSLKKWLEDIKRKRKEEDRLQRAEVHAALSVAGLAAALAAIAAENSKKEESSTTTTREAAVASAAALVAAQCTKVAEAMGANRDQLSNAISSARSSTHASDVFTLTAAASTSLKGAATLKARTGCKNNKLNGGTPVLQFEDTNHDYDLDFDKYRSMLEMGANLRIETPDGKYVLRSVSITLDFESKVILKLRKLNLLKSKKENIVIDMHAELYKDTKAGKTETCYLIVLRTNQGTVKLDMADDYQRYKIWTATINHMFLLSTSSTKYELQYK